MKLVVWLWNPWDKYKNTRHNIGFDAIDWFCDQYNFPVFNYESKFESFVSNSIVSDEKVLLAKPQTYMNLSWKAVSSISNFYKIPFEDILIVYDDIDMPTWKIRFKFDWAAWGHNWIKDTIKRLWTDKFWRLKIWIDRPDNKEMITPWVLWRFTEKEYEAIYSQKDDIVKLIVNWLDWKL